VVYLYGRGCWWWGWGGWKDGGGGGTMYTHVSKCKNKKKYRKM
jgi:hypothetical protein